MYKSIFCFIFQDENGKILKDPDGVPVLFKNYEDAVRKLKELNGTKLCDIPVGGKFQYEDKIYTRLETDGFHQYIIGFDSEFNWRKFALDIGVTPV